ncbi:AMP-dependent synthetase and ligase [Verminephrobacter eiseniae EF01-2]|uniref:AMP-dependent synthetase and ligase n=1 Tax=Verminephrobacter eiseniae (strain EF01-2) TaxID=391735 RepID=A1WPK7_VEREI|nr:AMP-dependent synthetase and ligase [Verminephrobacter eiseniae EF01-2]
MSFQKEEKVTDEIRPGSIEYWAVQTPDAQACIEGERSLTWRELNARANRVAQALHLRGVEHGHIVALSMEVRMEWLVLSGALAKLGCSMLGVNWRLTDEEARYVLSDSGAQVFITDAQDLAVVSRTVQAALVPLVVTIETPGESFVPWSELLEAPEVARQSLAEASLLIYTSGTTGLPKGVAVGRPSTDLVTLREYFESVDASGAVEGVRVQLVNMPMHHASGPSQMWSAIRKGRTLVLQRRFDAEGVLALIQKHHVHLWSGVPTMFKRLAGLAPEVLARYDVSSIRRIGVGAAPVPYALKLWMLSYFGRDTLQENYGSTETGMVCALLPAMQERKPGSSGLPFRHVSVEVRDALGHLLPTGQIGELWVKTPITIKQYLNEPALGEDVLDARGFFRTGDVGYLDEDGYLFITDRVKDMVITGGVNVYPAEIESVLMRHAAVEDVAVIGIPDEDFGEQVLAFCQLKAGRAANEADLLAHCERYLASYKQPRRIEFVEDLPRNGMGKVLKRELRNPYWIGKERRV